VSAQVLTNTAFTGGKYMTFRLGGEEYAIEILKVREIIGVLPMTRIPNKVNALRGVINLRGRIIPVVDVRQRFGLTKSEIGEQTVIIVVQYEQNGMPLTIGLLVDEVLEVLKLDKDQIEAQPEYGTGASRAQFVEGIAKLDQRMLFLVHLERMLESEEAKSLSFKGDAA
jgi:purine-binding chemotaxis protein CheW